MEDDLLQATVAREFWAGHTINGRPAAWSDMTHPERLRALDDHARRHAPRVVKAPVARTAPAPAVADAPPPAVAKLADDFFRSVKAYVKSVLDERMGAQQAELLSYVRSFERRITALEDQLGEHKAKE